MNNKDHQAYTDGDVRAALRACRQHFVLAAVFDTLVNMLLLAYPVFLYQIYDRVIPGKSWETLVALFIGLLLAVGTKAVFQWVRGILLVRASARIERRLSDRLFRIAVRRSASGHGAANAQLLRDLDSFRQFATGKGALAALDVPWGFLFLGIIIVVDPAIGVVATICMVISAIATFANTAMTKRALVNANVVGNSSQYFGDSVTRAAEAVVGLGMLNAVIARWRRERDKAIHEQLIASGRGVVFSSFLGSARILMQGAIMATGAVQVINGHIPAGLVFAAILIFQFAMKPVDQFVAAWDDYPPIRESMRRIDAVLSKVQEPEINLHLPKPLGMITVRDLVYVPPGADKPVLRRIGFNLEPGHTLGLIGLNGSGKTTLARVLTGSLRPSSGAVRVDGAELQQWGDDRLGEFIGYLPQNVSLLPGTVADNIGRFGRFSDEEIVEAAKKARVHDLVLRLPKGYETVLDENMTFSGGQRQLIALARAIIGKPSFVVLDEPNSNLDGPGEEALVSCVQALKEDGCTVILITHRPNLVHHLDHAAVLREGELVSFGSTTEVFQQLGRPTVVKQVSQANG
ncbi:type I secretion system permease/ATPase [Microvirga flavescens]|uniref:type I secretion system permease/ATPase n=1 Tax=Microvirga flavescens TaxID=2249811 RepID=UPI000DDADC49|nr:type I secretion system permease/ATPase [Microvirga flavescens]